MIAERKKSIGRPCALVEVIRYQPETPKRLMLGLKANLVPFVGEIQTEGVHNLDIIAPGVPVIWAMTHITSDVEMQSGLVVVGERFNTAIADHKTHHTMEDPVPFLSQKLAGMDNFYPITYRKGKNGENGKEVFRVADFARMLGAFRDGKAVAIAAHNPVYNGQLPERAGVGMVALASLAHSRLGQDAVIVPVAMDFQADEPLAIGGQYAKVAKDFVQLRRSDVTVHIGRPMALTPVDMETYLRIRVKNADFVTGVDVTTIKQLNLQLREQGNAVMQSLAGLLPPQKRGGWSQAA